MKAIRRHKVYAHQRTPLETVIPLSTPYSVDIDVSSLCNLSCNFCFHSDKTGIKENNVIFSNMTWDLYTKLIDDLAGFPEKIKKLMLSNFGEPLIHPHIAEMVQYAKQHTVSDRVEITTNGLLLTSALSDSLISAGLDKIYISVEALSDQGDEDIAGKRIDFRQFVDNVKYFYENKRDCVIYVKIADVALNGKEDEEFFYSIFEDICDEIAIEHIDLIWENTTADVSKMGVYGQPISDKEICTFLFTRMVVASDGKVVACCIDWLKKMIIGDANTQSLKEIWDGEKLRELQLLHLHKNRRSLPFCKECNAFKSSSVDDIDNFANVLIAKMQCEGQK